MAASERTAKQQLTHVRDLLARASRNRETNRLTEAEQTFLAAERALAAYTAATRGGTDKANEELRRIVEAERLLVYAMLYAHSLPADRVTASFEAALAAADNGLPGYFRGRVLCCWGATLLFMQEYAAAIVRLEQARVIFDNENRRDEYVQASYHLARAFVRCKRRDEAIAVLRTVTPMADTTVMSATRYTLASMTLLATLLWFKGQRDEGRRIHREALQRARANDLYRTVEYDHLLIIGRFGFLVYAIFPGKPLWPEI